MIWPTPFFCQCWTICPFYTGSLLLIFLLSTNDIVMSWPEEEDVISSAALPVHNLLEVQSMHHHYSNLHIEELGHSE